MLKTHPPKTGQPSKELIKKENREFIPLPKHTRAPISHWEPKQSQAAAVRRKEILSAWPGTVPNALVTRAPGTIVPMFAGAKRSLDDVFGGVVEDQRIAKRQHRDERADLVEKFKSYLRKVPHKSACGYCFGTGVLTGISHAPSECPGMGAARSAVFAQFDVNFREQISGKPCFKCLMHSLGGNELHADFKKGRCDYPNLLSGLSFAIWCDPSRRSRMRDELAVSDSWDTIQGFAAWIGKRLPSGEWPSMALWRLFEELS